MVSSHRAFTPMDAKIVRHLQDRPGASRRELSAAITNNFEKLNVAITRLVARDILTHQPGRSRTLQVNDGVFVDSRGVFWQVRNVANRNSDGD